MHVGLAVLVISAVKVECQAHTDPADGHNILLHPPVTVVLDIVGPRQEGSPQGNPTLMEGWNPATYIRSHNLTILI